VLAGFVLARASAGLVDSTIRNDTRSAGGFNAEDVGSRLSGLARELNVPIVTTSRLYRGRVGMGPTPDDLAESVAFAADTVILPHREDDAETPRVGEADLIVAHRSGPCATVTVAFEGRFGRLVDMAPAE